MDKIRKQHDQNQQDRVSNNTKLFQDAWSTALGNVTSTYASGIADMIVEGDVFKKSFSDLFKELVKEAAKLIIKLDPIK